MCVLGSLLSHRVFLRVNCILLKLLHYKPGLYGPIFLIQKPTVKDDDVFKPTRKFALANQLLIVKIFFLESTCINEQL